MDTAALLQQETAEIAAMDMSARVARSFAASYRWNPRNLEAHWYARSSQVWHDLVAGLPHMIVIPQFNLWYSPEEDEEVGDGDLFEERDSDEVEIRPLIASPTPSETPIKLEPDDDNQGCWQEPFSDDSMVTQPERNAVQCTPDFVILHHRTIEADPGHPRFLQLALLQVTHECCPVVIENKRMPSRVPDAKLYQEGFKNKLNDRIVEAMENLHYQCGLVFRRYTHAMSVIAVAVAGDYWTHKSISFNDAAQIDDDFILEGQARFQLDWPPPVAFGTAESNQRMACLRALLASKAH